MTELTRRSLLASAAAGTVLGSATATSASATRGQDSPAPPAPVESDDERPLAGLKTRFACNIEMWYRTLGFLDRIRAAHEAGFPAIEFWPWRKKPLDDIAELTGELGIEVAQFTAWGFVPGMNDPKNHDRFVEEVEASCEAAKKLRCRKMTIVAGNDQPGMTQREMHDHVIAACKRAAPICEDHGVMMILEAMNIRVDHKGHCLYGSEGAIRICREVASPMCKINWDLYHMQISEGDLCGHMREGFDQIGYLQLADHPGRREPGTGEIHYPRVLKQAYDLGYRDFVGCECNPTEDKAAVAALVRASAF